MSTESTQRKATRYLELDGLRGIAALGVVLFHVITLSQDLVPTETTIPLDLVSLSMGVHLFFMISGFVIFFTIRRSSSVLDFAISRTTRLYPSFWVALTITAAIGLMSPLLWLHVTPIQFIGNLTMVPAVFGIKLLDGVYWTLYVEMFFYALMAVLLGLGIIRRESLVLSLATVWALASAGMAAGYVLLGRPEGLVGKLADGLIVEYAPLFTIGMISLVMREKQRFDPRVVVAVASAVVSGYFMQGADHALKLLIPIAMFLAVISVPRVGLLRTRPLQVLGAVSYTWYLLHQNISYAIIDWLPNRYIAMAVALVVTFALSWLLHVTVETRFSPALRRWLRQKLVKA